MLLLTEVEIKQQLAEIDVTKLAAQQRNNKGTTFDNISPVAGTETTTALTRQSTAERKAADHDRLLGAVRRTRNKLQASEAQLAAALQQLEHAHMLNKLDASAELRRVEDRWRTKCEVAEAERERHEHEVAALHEKLARNQEWVDVQVDERMKLLSSHDAATVGTGGGGVESYNPYPPHWELNPADQNLELKPVLYSTHNEEWLAVQEYFGSALALGFTIKRVYRIQNRYLWRYYTHEKQRLAELRSAGAAAEEVVTKRLWHGTSTTDPKTIYMGEDGFDPRFSRPGLW